MRGLLVPVPQETVEALHVVARTQVMAVALQDRLLVEHAEVGRDPDLADLGDGALCLAVRQAIVRLAQPAAQELAKTLAAKSREALASSKRDINAVFFGTLRAMRAGALESK